MRLFAQIFTTYVLRSEQNVFLQTLFDMAVKDLVAPACRQSNVAKCGSNRQLAFVSSLLIASISQGYYAYCTIGDLSAFPLDEKFFELRSVGRQPTK